MKLSFAIARTKYTLSLLTACVAFMWRFMLSSFPFQMIQVIHVTTLCFHGLVIYYQTYTCWSWQTSHKLQGLTRFPPTGIDRSLQFQSSSKQFDWKLFSQHQIHWYIISLSLFNCRRRKSKNIHTEHIWDSFSGKIMPKWMIFNSLNIY